MHGLVERIDAMSAQQRRALRAALDERGEDFATFPLSYDQQRMWFVTTMYGARPVYTVPYAFWLRGPLDADALGTALDGLVGRQEALRTVFFDVDGVPYQTILPRTEFRLKVRRWRPPEQGREAMVRTVLDAEARRTFDLRRGPLLSANVLTAGDEHLFLFTLHHIVCDGWSMGILFRELELLYRAAVNGQQAELPPLPVRYVDFARWQRSSMTVERIEQLSGYWREQLAGAPARMHHRHTGTPGAGADHAGELELHRWPASVAGSVVAFSRREGVTPFVTMLAAFAETLRRRTGAEDLVIGTPVATRNRLELEGVVGFLVNTLPLRIRPSGGQSFRQLLRQVLDVTVGAQAHADLPFEMIVDTLAADRRGTENPLFQVVFSAPEEETEALRLPGLDVEIVYGHNGTAKFDLTASFAVLGDALKCAVEYRTALFDREHVRSLLAQLRGLLAAAIDAPDTPLSQLPDGAVR